ncbi:MAG TPA: lysyl oxidase family protein [Flavobacteriales bacterium]
MLRTTTALPAALLLTLGVQAQCINSFPSSQPFTSATVGTPGTLISGWANLGSDDLDWYVDNNGTPTAATGPIGDHTGNNTQGKYMYVEASGAGASPARSAILQSDCYNLSGLSDPYVTFWYHMQGAQMGSLHVDLNVNGSIVSSLWSRTGDQGGYWKQGWINLSAYAGQTDVRLRFRAITGSGELSDIAIDDVVVRSLVAAPGCTDPTAANYSSSYNLENGTCDYACPAGQSRVRIDIVADNYPQETTWTLRNVATNTLLASGTSTGTTLCVPSNACLLFRINDTAGDGIYHNSYGYGAYSIWLDGTLVTSGGQFGSYEETTFNCAPGQACAGPLPITLAPIGGLPSTLATVTASSLEGWYDLTLPTTGSYTVTTCGLNTCDTRLWMYDMNCQNLVLSDGVEGATFADDNDGGCGSQAVITANMEGGLLYHLRVGTAPGSCSAVTFRIIYNGPVVGCMDPASCNYDPLATIACSGCCIATGSPECPLGPDLTVDQAALQSSLSLGTYNVAVSDVCAVEEGCVRGFGQRYVIRFTTRINNIGELDYFIGPANQQSQMFSYNNCHGHAHYEGYADYVLFDQNSQAVPVGFKNGFCVMDIGCTPGHTAQYGCSTMGITAGCYDVYGSGTTCNWMDITDVPAGMYTMVVRTNWQQRPDKLGRHETNYANNFAHVCINITRNAQNVPSFSIVSGCAPVVDCTGQSFGSVKEDCTGTCSGAAKTGDLSANGIQDQPDAQEYVQRILGNDIDAEPCTDLNNDGRISVVDAALMANCYNQQHAHDQQEHVLHYHPWCEFPRGYTSLDTVDLRIAAINTTAGYVDIEMHNPSARVLGVEFRLSGLQVQSVQNLNPQVAGELLWSSTLGGDRVIGMSYVDSSVAKGTAYVPLCRVHYLSLTGAQVCISEVIDAARSDGNAMVPRITGSCMATNLSVVLRLKALLDGPYAGNGLMRDDLRVNELIPEGEPYSAMGFTQIGGGGGETVAPSVFAVTGDNAIVDWVLVELRSSSVPGQVLATRSALLQRDGDVVAVDGVSPVGLGVAPGSYHVALRHRNHFGVMTASPITLGATATDIDLRLTATPVWGSGARKTVGAYQVMWAGNTYRDALLKYTGNSNDRDPILAVLGGTTPTHTVTGYLREDVDLSGVIKYTGVGNDRDRVLLNIGGVVPTATLPEQLP